MIRLQWNALQVGHHVLVHDEDDPNLALTPGRVMTIQPASGTNEVTIRLSRRGTPARVVQPRRLAVHLDDGEPSERCWRCEVHYESVNQGPPNRPGTSARQCDRSLPCRYVFVTS